MISRGPFKVVCYVDDFTDVLTEFVSKVNNAQESFQLKAVERADVTWNPQGDTADVGSLARAVRGRAEVCPVIAVVSQPLRDDHPSLVDDPAAVVTTSILDRAIQEHAHAIIKAHVVRCVALLSVQRSTLEPPHGAGCIFDHCRRLDDMISCVRMGKECLNCSVKLRGLGFQGRHLEAFHQMMTAATGHLPIALPPRLLHSGCPKGEPECTMLAQISRGYSERNVFLSSAFGPEWRSTIRELEANVGQSTGMSFKVSRDVTSLQLLCRVCRDIRMCRYGIAELSSFRLNVAYEIGLMHALGLECAVAVARDRSAEFESRFSDLKGLYLILYESTADLIDQVRRFLTEENAS